MYCKLSNKIICHLITYLHIHVVSFQLLRYTSIFSINQIASKIDSKMELESEWTILEKCIGDKVPMCLKVLLWKTGYDSLYSVKYISNDNIEKIEKFIQRKRKLIMPQLDELCDENDTALAEYKKQRIFEFLPGHRSILLDLPRSIENMQSQVMNADTTDLPFELPSEYSVILKEFVDTANNNLHKSKNAYQYNDIVKYFSTYIFLLCGRTCYETLNKNLPIPSTKTICKLNQSINKLCRLYIFFILIE